MKFITNHVSQRSPIWFTILTFLTHAFPTLKFAWYPNVTPKGQSKTVQSNSIAY